MGKRILMNTITLPIFVVEGNDVMIFPSIEDIQIQLEPIHIKDNIHISYDAEGRLLKLVTDGRDINILPAEEDPSHAAELEGLLRNYLIAINEPMAKEITCDLSCLVNLSKKYVSKVYSLREMIINLWNKLTK